MHSRIVPIRQAMAIASNTANYVYFDDLQVTHHERLSVVQADDYYPFGMTMAGLEYRRGDIKDNDYLYNGKELQEDHDLNWYDYGARMYDASLGRWSVVDPMAEEYFAWTPYHYTMNNSINAIDPNGKEVYYLNSEEAERILRELNAIFRKTYELDYDVFCLETRIVTREEIYDPNDQDTWDSKSDDNEFTYKEVRTYIVTDNNSRFNWDEDRYAAATFDIFNSRHQFRGDIVEGNTKIHNHQNPNATINGTGGGFAYKKERTFWTSSSASPGVALHELVHHFHYLGNEEGSLGLQKHFNLEESSDHPGKVRTNWPQSEKERLDIIRKRTGKVE